MKRSHPQALPSSEVLYWSPAQSPHLRESVFRVHVNVGKMVESNGVERGPQCLFDVITVEIRLGVEKKTRLHGHASAAEPIFVEVIQGIAVLIGEEKIVFVVLKNPLGLG